MIKRLIRVILQILFFPITILLWFISVLGLIIDVLILPIEYTITGRSVFTYFSSERIWAKPFFWFTFLIDNISYYIYCKIYKVKYEHNYWFINDF